MSSDLIPARPAPTEPLSPRRHQVLKPTNRLALACALLVASLASLGVERAHAQSANGPFCGILQLTSPNGEELVHRRCVSRYGGTSSQGRAFEAFYIVARRCSDETCRHGSASRDLSAWLPLDFQCVKAGVVRQASVEVLLTPDVRSSGYFSSRVYHRPSTDGHGTRRGGIDLTLSGRVTGGVLRGRVRIRRTYPPKVGAKSGGSQTCDTGTVSFLAAR